MDFGSNMNYADMSINTTKNQADMMNSWNQVFDWTFNVTGKRQLQAQQALANKQYLYQSDLMGQQYGYSRRMADYNYQLSRLMQDQQQKYVNDNMSKQMIYNQLLSNRGRDIAAMRSNGLNPASGSSIPSGSVSPGGVPSAQSSQALGGAPGFSMPSFNQPAAHGYGGYSSVAKALADVRNTNAEAQGQEIKNKFGILREMYGIKQMQAAIARDEREAQKLGTETYKLWMFMGKEYDKLQKELVYMDQSTKTSKQLGDAAEKNAATQEAALQVDKDWKEGYLKVLKIQALNDQKRVELESNRNPSVISELEARAKKLNTEASYTEQEILWFADKMMSLLDLNDAKIQQLKTQSNVEAQQVKLLAEDTKLREKEVSWFEERILFDQVNKAVNTLGDLIPFKGARDKVVNKIVDKVQNTPYKRREETFNNAQENSSSWDNLFK